MAAPKGVSARAALAVLMVPASALYLLLDPEENRFLPWLAIFTLQFVLYAGLALLLHRRRPIPLALVFTCALAARVVLWFSHPVFEADYYRYLWDGHVLAEGVNPYAHPPDAPALDEYETDYRFFIQWSQYRTIYPPVAQYVFALAHALAPDSLLGLKIVLTLFDLATGVILLFLFERRGLSGSLCALYLLNPLVLKEVANSAHVDSVAVFFSTAALYLFETARRGRAFVLLAFAAGAKLYAAVLGLLFVRLDQRYRRNAFAAVVTLALLYAPFLDAGWDVFAGGVTFARHWVFNASLYRLLSSVAPTPEMAKILAGCLFALFVGLRVRLVREPSELSKAALSILGALLLLSPVVNAWYVLWIVPFACLERSFPWLAFSYLVGFSYSWFYAAEKAYHFQILEYAALFALLLQHRFRRIR